MIRGKEVVLAAASFTAGVGMAAAAFWVEGYWRSMLLDLGMVFVTLAAGLIVVNLYLDRSARKSAMEPLIELIETSIQEHHNDLMDKAWERIGKPQFNQLVDRYLENDRDPLALTPDERDAIYNLVKFNRENLALLHHRLEEDLRELALIMGWSFDPKILEHVFRCRYSIARMRNVSFDDSDAAKREVSGLLLNIDLDAFSVHSHLAHAVGFKAKDMYYD
jgi:hypothetical protein